MSNDFPSQSGDIILISSNSRKSANIFAQSLIRRKKALHSHVAVALKLGNAIHAMPNGGVHTASIHELLTSGKYSFQVYRNTIVNTKVSMLISSRDFDDCLLYYSRQKYNFWIFTLSRNNASFCSELVAKAYKKIGISISKKRTSSTLPIDIYNYVSVSKEWENVTESYKSFFLDENFKKVNNLASAFVRALEQGNQDMAIGQNNLIKIINSVEKQQGLKKSTMRPSRNYWHIDNNQLYKKLVRFIKNISKNKPNNDVK